MDFIDELDPNATQWDTWRNTNAGGKVTWTVYDKTKLIRSMSTDQIPIDIRFSKPG